MKKIKELLMDENRMDEIRKNAVKRARTTHTYEKQIKEREHRRRRRQAEKLSEQK